MTTLESPLQREIADDTTAALAIARTKNRINQQEMLLPTCWKTYIQHLGERFQVRITEPNTKLVLGGLEPQRRLLIGTHHTFAVVSHGQAIEGYDHLPDEEILFDITETGDWLVSEVMYSKEALSEFQQQLLLSRLTPMDEQNLDIELFSTYVLGKIAREEWIEARI